MKFLRSVLVSIAILSFAGCDYTDFQATSQNPNARPIDLRTEHVAAVLLSANESMRHSFENNLARQLNEQGIRTTPGYELVSNADVTNKEEILDDLHKTNADHAIFMRIIDRRLETSSVPGSARYPDFYNDPSFWANGAFIGPGGVVAWPPYYDGTYHQTNDVDSVEILVYSVPDRELVWTGRSRTFNPNEIDDFVKELVHGAVKHLRKTGMLVGVST